MAPRSLVGGGLLVAVALGIGQVLAYAQTLVAARTLTPAQFGAFQRSAGAAADREHGCTGHAGGRRTTHRRHGSGRSG